ncbi:MAG: hypothetical protein IH849_04280 [Acidobacteria bacterium]|nr:hypothetical protein [Acidobacteriota bacterium]
MPIIDSLATTALVDGAAVLSALFGSRGPEYVTRQLMEVAEAAFELRRD